MNLSGFISLRRGVVTVCVSIALAGISVSSQTNVGDEYKGVEIKHANAVEKPSPVVVTVNEGEIIKKFHSHPIG